MAKKWFGKTKRWWLSASGHYRQSEGMLEDIRECGVNPLDLPDDSQVYWRYDTKEACYYFVAIVVMSSLFKVALYVNLGNIDAIPEHREARDVFTDEHGEIDLEITNQGSFLIATISKEDERYVQTTVFTKGFKVNNPRLIAQMKSEDEYISRELDRELKLMGRSVDNKGVDLLEKDDIIELPYDKDPEDVPPSIPIDKDNKLGHTEV